MKKILVTLALVSCLAISNISGASAILLASTKHIKKPTTVAEGTATHEMSETTTTQKTEGRKKSKMLPGMKMPVKKVTKKK